MNPDDLRNLEPQFEEQEAEPPTSEAQEESAGGDPTEEQAPPEQEPVTYSLPGDLELDENQAAGLAEFYRWASDNPETVRAMDSYFAGESELVPRQKEPDPEPEPEIDYDDLDPAVAERLKRIDALEEEVRGLSTSQQASQMKTAQAVITQATEQFQTKYDLDDDTLEKVLQTTARLQILPGLAENSQDSIAAAAEAFETAYWATPELRQREIDRRVQAADEDAKRRRKASALNGSSGSIPRTNPDTDGDSRAAMVADLRAAMEEGSLGG